MLKINLDNSVIKEIGCNGHIMGVAKVKLRFDSF
jgi:hypothetical protein